MQKKELKGLGGWLILPMIGLILAPFRLIYQEIIDPSLLFVEETYTVLTEPTSIAYHALWVPLLIGDFLLTILTFFFFCLLLWHAFKHSIRFPQLFIVWLIFNLVAQLIGLSLALQILSDMPAEIAREIKLDSINRSVGQSFLGALIWIPYFLRSRRVKNTFIQPYGIIPLKKAALHKS